MTDSREGFSRTGVLVTLVCVIIIGSVSWVLISRANAEDRLQQEVAQLRGIHQSWLVFAREFEGRLPTPGLIDRLPFNGVEEPGRGEEDVTQNTTANLHSGCVMQNYYAAGILVSPYELSPRVRVLSKQDYNFAAYNIGSDVYWDSTFKADLATESSVSYASLAIIGRRKEKQWRESLDSTFAVLGNRGPQDGKPHARSLTCNANGQWKGFIQFNDNAVTACTSVQSPYPFKDSDGADKPDNLFAIDDGPTGGDVILSFTKSLTHDSVELQWD